MTIFVFMKKMNIKNKYVFSLVIISIMVAFLIHFPELVSLFDVTGQNALFPDMSVLDVANEVFFTFVSLLLLFAMNTYVFGFNRQKARISWQKVLLSFVMTWCVNNLLGKGFVFLHHQFDIPAIDALVHHYLHPLRDFIMSCVVTGSCYMIYLIRQSQQVQNALFPDMSVLDVANEVFFTFVSLLLLFAMNTYVFGFNRQKARISWQKVLLSFVMTWCVNNLLGKGFVFLHHQFDIPAIDALVHHYLHPLRDFIMSCVVTGSCYMIYLIRQSQQVQVENQQLRAENLLNQYEALKSQLNPHMLFNSLNTLRSLIRETPGKAQEYLQELSRVLRYTLQENECRSVTLREEMDFVNAYIFLLKMRYEDNLVFDIDLGKEHESKQLPPMSVQLLIENAVKHNEISNRHSLTISVRSDHDSLTVSNPIQPKLTHSGGTGIGLVNLSKRYNLLYKKDISIKEDASIFSVTIPLV